MDNDNRTVWAFAQIPDPDARAKVFQEVQSGKSRFGCWSFTSDLREHRNGELDFLTRIKPGDWIVHVNLPHRGRCVAVEVSGSYNCDEGLPCAWDKDFKHYIEVNPSTLIEFDRRDQNILPTVNLNPRARYQRVLAKADFFTSINNLKGQIITLKEGESKELLHLRDKMSEVGLQVTRLIHQTHKGKNLERFMAKVFRNIPNVVDVRENGFGWRTDHGADLIVTIQSGLGNLQFERKIVVQVKSFEGHHYDLSGVHQVVHAIERYEADAGMIITTAEPTEQLWTEIAKQAETLGKPIDLIAGKAIARFVLANNPNLLFEEP